MSLGLRYNVNHIKLSLQDTKEMSKYFPNLLIRTLSIITVVAFLWVLKPEKALSSEEKSLRRDEELPNAQEIYDEPKINLMREHLSSESAQEEMLKGRFVLDTSILKKTKKSEVYRQLILRQGILIALDSTGQYHYLARKQRIPIDSLTSHGIDLGNYALHRPRKIAPNDFCHLTAETIPGDELFLVMPNSFETGVFAMIEKSLPNPLSEYSKANLAISLSKGNNLSFLLEKVFTKDGQLRVINHSLNGL
jgi:hypothetical protein